MDYRRFLWEARLEQLHSGDDGLRLVGAVHRDPDGTLRLGLIVPHNENPIEWEADALSLGGIEALFVDFVT